MKKLMTTILAASMVLIAGAALVSGYGKSLTASTTPAVVAPPSAAKQCSVTVTGTETVYFMKNCSTNYFVLTNAIPVTAGFPYTFSGRISKMCYATASGSSDFLIAFE